MLTQPQQAQSSLHIIPILPLLDALFYTHIHMHTNIQYMTCYMSLYKCILYNYLPFRLGYYRSKRKISRTGHYLGHSGVSVGRLMHSSNAAGRAGHHERVVMWKSSRNIQNMSIFTSSSYVALLGQHSSCVWPGALDSGGRERESQVHGRATEGAETARGPPRPRNPARSRTALDPAWRRRMLG